MVSYLQYPFTNSGQTKIKILYTNFHPRNGGGHVTYIMNLLRGLADHHQLTVATPGSSRLYRYSQTLPGVRVVDVRFTTRPSSWFKDRTVLKKLIIEGRFDIVHVNGSADHKQVLLATLGMRHRPRIVFTKHNDHPLTSFGHRLRAYWATDHVIAVSDYIHTLIAASPYRRCGITTVRHGINTTFFAPPDPDSVDTWRDMFFGAAWRGKLLLGSAAGTDTDKGWLNLLEAVATLPPAQRGRIMVLVAGDLPAASKLARVKQLGLENQVVFPGLLDDVRPALGACHVGFVVSYREALSFACREMMALGLPVLVTAAGGLPENVEQGVDGWIVPVGEVGAIRNVLSDLLQRPERLGQMAVCAREKSGRDFNLDNFVQSTLAVYQKLLP